LIARSGLTLFITEDAWSEVRHELRKRVDARERHGSLDPGGADELFDDAIGAASSVITVVPFGEYAHREREARRRIPRDPNDWPTVALALTLEAAIWTHDHDFLGCGLPTWTTETLLLHLEA